MRRSQNPERVLLGLIRKRSLFSRAGQDKVNSIVIQKLLSTNAHLGRRVAAHHFKVYLVGSRNGIAIIDSDKTLILFTKRLSFYRISHSSKRPFLLCKYQFVIR